MKVMRGRYSGSKYSRRVAREKREVGGFVADLSRLSQLAAAIPDEETLDKILLEQPDMAPDVKAECRKLILSLMRKTDEHAVIGPTEQG